VFVHDIAAKTTRKVPNPGSKDNYYGSLTPEGNLYFGHAAGSCGQFVKIERWVIGDPGDPVVVAALPAHIDLGIGLSAFTKADMHTDVYFDRADCRTRFSADVFVIHDAETAARALRGSGGDGGASRRLSMADAQPRRGPSGV
jgi:hypothetical protein